METKGDGLILKRPLVDKTQAVELARRLFGFYVSDPKNVKEFVSFCDRNFYLKGTFKLPELQNGEAVTNGARDSSINSSKEDEFVLKVLNRVDSSHTSLVDAQNELMLFLSQNGVECCYPVKSLHGSYNFMLKNNAAHGDIEEAVRLLKFVPGKEIKDVPCSPSLLSDLGRFVAKFHRILKQFYHPALEGRVYHWHLQHIDQIKPMIFSAKTNADGYTELLKHVYVKFTEEVLPLVGSFEKQVIHGDLNENNILVVENGSDEGYRISGILDFGHITFSYRLFDIGICMAYMIIAMCESGCKYSDAIHASRYLLAGYQDVWPLLPTELELLYWTVAARVCQSFVIGSSQSSLEPENLYLQQSLKTKKELLKHYVDIPKDELMRSWTSPVANVNGNI